MASPDASIFGLEPVQRYLPARLLQLHQNGELQSYTKQKYQAFSDLRPRYNIISYTWGRFVKKTAPYPTTIQVGGIPWRIPSIIPSSNSSDGGFTAAQFERAIKTASRDADFIWLDVACIPQNYEEIVDPELRLQLKKEAEFEIRKQAVIFKSAHKAFVWLHGANGSNCHEIIAALSGKPGKSSLGLLRDQWFSSLWTLQEAYQRKDACLLSLSGNIINVRGSPVTVSSVIEHFTTHNEIISMQLSPMRLSGLEALAGRNPLPLLGVARHRQATHLLDNVYGIMAVFNVDLKKNAAEIPNEQTFDQLFLRFYAAINIKSCVVSQAWFTSSKPRKGYPTWAPYIGKCTTLDRSIVVESVLTADDDDTEFVPKCFYNMIEVKHDNSAKVKEHGPGQLDLEGTWFSLHHLQKLLGCSYTSPGHEDSLSSTASLASSIEKHVETTSNKPIRSVWVYSPYRVAARGTRDRDPSAAVTEMIRSEKQRLPTFVIFIGNFNVGGGQGLGEGSLGIIVQLVGEEQNRSLVERIGFCTWNSTIYKLQSNIGNWILV